MQKFVSYFVVAAMIISTVLMSCDKEDKRPKDDECICLYIDIGGVPIGGDIISDEEYKAIIFLMYPNPTDYVVSLMFKTTEVNIVTITDKKGKVLFKQSFDVQTVSISISDYPVGKYWVTVDNGKQKSTLCLIKVAEINY